MQDMKLKLIEPDPLLFEIFESPDHPPYDDKVYEYFKKKKEYLTVDEIYAGTDLSISAVRKAVARLSNPSVNKIIQNNFGHIPKRYELVKEKK